MYIGISNGIRTPKYSGYHVCYVLRWYHKHADVFVVLTMFPCRPLLRSPPPLAHPTGYVGMKNIRKYSVHSCVFNFVFRTTATLHDGDGFSLYHCHIKFEPVMGPHLVLDLLQYMRCWNASLCCILRRSASRSDCHVLSFRFIRISTPITFSDTDKSNDLSHDLYFLIRSDPIIDIFIYIYFRL